MAKDISAVGCKVIIGPQKSGDTSAWSESGLASVNYKQARMLVISEFSDEGTPFECADVDVSTNAKNLNGEMISSRTPSVYSFSVTVIPGTTADDTLSQWFRAQAIQPGNNAKEGVQQDFYYKTTIMIPRIFDGGSSSDTKRTVTFTNCRPKSGPFGPSTSAEGRLSARTYTFEAEAVTLG